MTEVRIDDERSTLLRRAVELARRPAAAATGQLLDLVTFRVGNEVFAIESRFVCEVVRLRHVSVVPGTPPAVRGVTTYQGEILAIVDLLVVLGIEGDRLRDSLWILVVGEGSAEFGITADELRGSLELSVEALLSTADGRQHAVPFVRATTSDAIAVLDGTALLAATDIFGGTAGQRAAMRPDHALTTAQKENRT